jgi:pimeloyl-ACP methyl ester carboxylesterase
VHAAAMHNEAIPGLDVVYGQAMSDKGYRVRTYTTRPAGVRGRLPVIVFIPWLSCDAVERPFGPGADGWAKMMQAVMRGVPAQFVRIEKPGVGDSEGPDCSASDLDHDMAGFRAGIRAALADPGADPTRWLLFGGSVGAALVPLLASEFHPRGLIATGGFARTWHEHMLDIERRRLTLSGRTPAEVNAAMKSFAEFYDAVLLQGLTPAAAIARKPELARVWYDGPAHHYGRPIRYYQQLQSLDVETAWDRVRVPTLVLWGDYDWIMGRDEPERSVALLRARDPPLVTYVVRHGMNHHFDVFPDPVAAFNEENGTFDEGAAQAIVDWISARLRDN